MALSGKQNVLDDDDKVKFMVGSHILALGKEREEGNDTGNVSDSPKPLTTNSIWRFFNMCSL